MSDSSVAAPAITRKKGLGKISAIFACGTALFSDGYQNGVVGEINTILKRLYPEQHAASNYGTLFSSMGFAGTVVGMLAFGYIADRVGRKHGMMIATIIVAVFTALAAGAYGAGGSATGLFQALVAYRFLTGIGIGAEYPAGSVAASENTEDPGVPKTKQHALFVLATNCAIDVGFVIAAFVPLVFLWICGDGHLRLVWRLSFGFGVLPPLLVLLWRLKMVEPVRYQKEAIKKNVPYLLIWKKYWRSFVGVSIAWFLYDFIVYPFGLFSSTILDSIYGDTTSLRVIFGWNVVLNLFYIPGCMFGALVVDRVGPKRLLVTMLCVQGVFGFFMSGFYVQLSKNVAGFAVMYGLFLSFGEAGPGDCLGLLASKSWPTAIRGQAYGVAAAIGKIGAFVGTWAFPQIIAAFPEGPKQTSGPFWIGSGLAILSAIIVLVLIPEVPANRMTDIDAEFRIYLAENGFDVSTMGLKGHREMDQESGDAAKVPAEVEDEKKGDEANV